MKKRAREIGGRLADILAERYQEPGEIGLILFDLGAWRGDLVQKGAPRESWDAILAHLFTQGGFGAWRAAA